MTRSLSMIGVAAAMLSGTFAAAFAQVPGGMPAARQPGDELHFYVLTMGPGDDVWEKFGHNALRVVDDNVAGEFHDVAYNWGTFSFENGFVAFCAKFVQGRLMYSMYPQRFPEMVQYYQKDLNRSVFQQELNLGREQKLKLRDALLWTDTDAHRFYKYDYFRDNCSTRVRDAVNGVCQGRLAAATINVPAGGTYRWHTRRHIAGTPWLYVALQGVLGHPVDRPVSRWDEMFLPLVLRDELRNVRVPDPNGGSQLVPLVKEEKILYQSTRPSVSAQPPRTTPLFLLIGFLYSALLLGLGHFVSRKRWARWAFVVAALPWLLLMGLAGPFLLYTWCCTDHVATGWNENLLHVSPVMLPIIVLLPMLVFQKRWAAEAARWILASAAALAAAGALLKAVPAFYQVNGDIIALTLPVNASLAFIAWMLADRLRRGTPASPAKSSGMMPKEQSASPPPSKTQSIAMMMQRPRVQ